MAPRKIPTPIHGSLSVSLNVSIMLGWMTATCDSSEWFEGGAREVDVFEIVAYNRAIQGIKQHCGKERCICQEPLRTEWGQSGVISWLPRNDLQDLRTLMPRMVLTSSGSSRGFVFCSAPFSRLGPTTCGDWPRGAVRSSWLGTIFVACIDRVPLESSSATPALIEAVEFSVPAECVPPCSTISDADFG